MAEVRAPVAGAGWVDQHHEHEDAEDDDEDDEPARHGAGVLQGQPFVVTSPFTAQHARAPIEIQAVASVLQLATRGISKRGLPWGIKQQTRKLTQTHLHTSTQ